MRRLNRVLAIGLVVIVVLLLSAPLAALANMISSDTLGTVDRSTRQGSSSNVARELYAGSSNPGVVYHYVGGTEWEAISPTGALPLEEVTSESPNLVDPEGAYPTNESPHPYTNNFDNTWAQTCTGAASIRVHFTYIRTESSYDHLYVKDGAGVVVNDYTGNYTDVWSSWVPGDTIQIRLSSDYSIVSDGFVVDRLEWSTDEPRVPLGYAVLDLVEYNGSLYAATMSTSNPRSGVGQVWRYDGLDPDTGEHTWTLVGNNMDDQVCDLVVYNGHLYAGTAWNGGKIYRYDDVLDWTPITTSGWSGVRAAYVWNDTLYLGDIGYDKFGHYTEAMGTSFTYDQNAGGSCIYDFEYYDGYLYGSAWQGRLHRSPNGTSWSCAIGYNDGNLWELEVFQDYLYMGDDSGRLMKYDGATQSTEWTAPDGIISMTPYGDNLYFGIGGEAGAYYGSSTSGTGKVYSYDGTGDPQLISGNMGTGIQVLYWGPSLVTNVLYAGTSNPGKVNKYAGDTTWEVISPELGYAVLSLVEYGGQLYAGTMSTSNPLSGIGKVWRCDGYNPSTGEYTWTLVGNNMEDQVCDLVVYNDKLYAGTAWNGGRLYKYTPGTTVGPVTDWTLITTSGWNGVRAAYVWGDTLYLGDIQYDKFGHYTEAMGTSFTYDQSLSGSCIYDFEYYNGYLYASAWNGRLHRSTDGTSWSVAIGYNDGNLWELERFGNYLYMGQDSGQLKRYDGTNATTEWTAPDGIISMTTDRAHPLFFGIGGEAGAYYGTSGTGKVYSYNGTGTPELISATMGTGVQVLYLGAEIPPVPEWTFMVYLDADNDLEAYGIDNFLQMSSVGSSSDVNIVVQFDRIAGDDNRYDDWDTCKRFLVTAGMEPTAGNALQDIGEVNMGNPDTLADFATWAIDNYPAQHYALVLWNHGDAWRTGLCLDETSSDDYLTTPELKQALQATNTNTGVTFDILGFDACLMATAEVDYQIRDYANIRVGSEELEPVEGWPYDDILGALIANSAMTPEGLATEIVNDYIASYGTAGDETQSAVDLTCSGSLAAYTSSFAQALIDAGDWSVVDTARTSVEKFGSAPRLDVDLYHFAALVEAGSDDATVDAAAQDLMNAITPMVIAEGHGSLHADVHGVSIYFPADESNYDAAYATDVDFTADTQWDEFLLAYYAEGPAVTLTPLTPDPTNDNTPTFVGTATDEDTVWWVEYRVDGGSWTAATASDEPFDSASENYTFTTALLADGPHTVEVRAEDLGGKWTALANYATDTFTVDTTAPAVTITPLTPDPTSDNTPAFSGTATDAASPITSVEYRVDGGSWAAATFTPDPSDPTTGTYTFTTSSLADGLHSVEARATDDLNNVTLALDYASDAFTVDTTGPVITLTFDRYTDDTTPTFSGTATNAQNIASVEHSVDGGSWNSISAPDDETYDEPSEEFTFTISAVAEGDHVIQVRSEDAGGAQTTVEYVFTVDTTAPSVTLTPLAPDPTGDSTPTLHGTATDAGSSPIASVEYRVWADANSNGVLDSGELELDWTLADSADVVFDELEEDYFFSTSPIADGEHQVDVRATDAAGNVTTATGGTYASDTFVVNTVPPVVDLTLVPTDPTYDTTPTFNGTATDTTIPIMAVEYRVDGRAWVAAEASDEEFDSLTEDFTFTTSELADGQHTVEVRAIDRDGNATAEANFATYTFTVDTVPPALILVPLEPDPNGDNTPTFEGGASDATSPIVSVEYSIWTDLDGDGILDTEDANRNGVLDPGEDVNGNGVLDAGELEIIWTEAEAVDGAFDSTNEVYNFTSSLLADGSHIVDVRATDSLGNVTVPDGTYAADTFTIDATGPALTLTSAPGEYISDPTPDFAGTATDAHEITSVEYRVWTDLDGDGILDLDEDVNANGILDAGEDVNLNGILDTELEIAWTAAIASDGALDSSSESFDFTTDALDDSTHTVDVRGWDVLGNATAEEDYATYTFTVDTTPPVDKSVSHDEIWQAGMGTPDETTVTLTVEGPGATLVVTDVLPGYIVPVAGSYSVTPTSITTDPVSGETTLMWDHNNIAELASLAPGESWQVSFKIKSNEVGLDKNVDVVADSKITYTDHAGVEGEKTFPEALVSVYAPLTAEKSVDIAEVWQKGVGTPYKTMVTLTLTGPGEDIVVTEVLPDYVNLEGGFTVTPDNGYPVTNPDGTRTIQWTVGTLYIEDVWAVSFDVSFNIGGTKVEVDVVDTGAADYAKATYKDWTEATPTVVFPQAYVAVKAPLTVEVNIAPVYFAGLTAEAYILTTIGGAALDADIESVRIYFNDGTEWVDLTDVVELVPDAEGLYRVEYKIPGGAPMGGYKMIVKASAVGLYGTSSGVFQVLSIPMEVYGQPVWIFAVAGVVAFFILLMIAVRIATWRR